jgi:hypothetical protein
VLNRINGKIIEVGFGNFFIFFEDSMKRNARTFEKKTIKFKWFVYLSNYKLDFSIIMIVTTKIYIYTALRKIINCKFFSILYASKIK